ncbi:MAG: zf-HC2 domain-containing protein [Gemmatimonadota bacterium]
MSHLEDGTLQAFLDDELAPAGRAEVAEHMLGCERCRTRHAGLSRANALFTDAMAAIDVAPPVDVPSGAPRRRARRSAGSLVKAAGLILALAAAASAAVPGSPVRMLIATVVDREPASAASEAPPVRPETPPVEIAPPAPAGVSIATASDPVVVSLDGLTEVVIRLEATDAGTATVAVVGAERDPVFRTGSGRIDVAEGTGGQVRVSLPAGSPGSRLLVDGRVYAEIGEDGLTALVTAEADAGALIWR